MHKFPANKPGLLITALLALVWLAVLMAAAAHAELPSWLRGATVLALVAAVVVWARWARGRAAITRALVFTASYVVLWDGCVLLAEMLGAYEVRATLARYGLGGLFLIGLAWVVCGVERASRYYAAKRHAHQSATADLAAHRAAAPERIWNPLDLDAWYYGRESRKLNQSMATLTTYSILFLAACVLVTQIQGCKETYEMPAGGGQSKMMVAQTVRVKKVIKKKYVINPFSMIKFEMRPVDDVKLQLAEVTAHMYKVGYGDGDGAGFAGGTKRGEVRFIRLEYAGGDWDQDFGLGGDVNLLNEYGARTGQKVATKTESRSVAQLASFPAGKSPPLVYMTGQRNITLSKSEAAILRDYLLEKHGMLFADNGGSPHFHSQFFSMMRQVLPHVEPVRVPLDDIIHRQPYPLPFLPYVAPHGGRDAWGWKVDGRWVCYYHPGDIGDAWSDDHAGVTREVWEACYQLGTNVIFYAHAEYAKWLMAKQKQ